MKKNSRRLFVAALTVFTIGAVATVVTEAEARSASAINGAAPTAGQAACFTEWGGEARQYNCSYSAAWLLPIIYDNAGGVTIRINARGANRGANNITCRAYSQDNRGVLRIGSSDITEYNDGRVEELRVNVYAPGFGGTYAACFMDRWTRLLSYTW